MVRTMSDPTTVGVTFSIPERAVEILRALSEAHGLRLSWAPSGTREKPSVLKLTPRGVEGVVRWRCECSSTASDLHPRVYVGSLRGSTMAAMRDYVSALHAASGEAWAAAGRARIPARKAKLEEAAKAVAKVASSVAAAMPELRAEWPEAAGVAPREDGSDVD